MSISVTHRWLRCMHEVPMYRFGFVLVLGMAAAFAVAANGQPANTPLAPAPAQELPKTYIPGLGEFMGRIQVDHAKIWLAGQARNWDLAGYQLGELKEVFSDVQDLVPQYQNVPVGDMIEAIITGTITDLEGAIAKRDLNSFSTSFDKLTAACNTCHQAANRAYIAIRRPTQSTFSNQDFSPPKP
jgi:hypothetical protein